MASIFRREREDDAVDEQDMQEEVEVGSGGTAGGEERRSRRSGSRRRSTGRRSQPERRGNKSRNRVIRYFQETSEELRKVTWPTRAQTMRLTVIVLISMLILTVFLGALDLGFQRLAGLLLAT